VPRNNGDFHDGKMKALYHATDSDNVASILSEGLVGDDEGTVWLAHSPKAAVYGAMLDISSRPHTVFKATVSPDKLSEDRSGRYVFKKHAGDISPENLSIVDKDK
jgi:hypothetical protein